MAEQRADRHVGRLARGRGPAVVRVDVPVDVDDADPADHVARPRDRAHDQRAAPAQQQRPAPERSTSATAALTVAVVSRTDG